MPLPLPSTRLATALALTLLIAGPAAAAGSRAEADAPSASSANAERPAARSSRAAAERADAKPAAKDDGERGDAPATRPKPPLRPIEDPKASEGLDTLRQRLNERLGGALSSEVTAPGELKLTTRAAAEVAERRATATRVARAAPRTAPTLPARETHEVHWSYAGEGGPEQWAKLKPDYAACGSGSRQSPIDIREGLRLQLDPVQFDYRETPFRVIDNGHTVQVNVAPGNSIELLGRRFELVQFHFHRPSEERIDGRQFEMSLHLVHRDLEGKLAVVGVLFEAGPAHPVVQAVWNNLPLEKNVEVPARAPIDLAALLPADRRYISYMGSLTTPPCSEGVLWVVMKVPATLTREQLGIFARLYPMNARPVQPIAGRLIKESQ